MQLPEHGANPHHVYKRLGLKQPPQLIDFSENCNPAGLPRAVLKQWAELIKEIQSYPDPSGEPFLSAAAEYHGILKSHVFVGNGAAELLTLVAERYSGKTAIIVHPTFSEYERTLLAKNVAITRIVATEKKGFKLPVQQIMEAMETASVLYLCTPNNPTGILPSRNDLLKIVQHGAEIGCDIILDEAFIDFVDESLSFISDITNQPHLTIVRSMTKMYAIPGIRLGYVVADPVIIHDLQNRAPHWNVNGIAVRIGALCLQEKEYRRQAISYAADEREKIKKVLKDCGFRVTDSVTNYLSFKPGTTQDAERLYSHLLTRGLVLRHTENFRGMDGRWLRIGIKNSSDMRLLTKEIEQWATENSHS